MDDFVGDEGSGAEVEDILGKEAVVETDAVQEEATQRPSEDFDEGEAAETPEWLDAELQWRVRVELLSLSCTCTLTLAQSVTWRS